MGLKSFLSGLVNGPYRYRQGPATLGIGVENMALEQPLRAIDQDFNSARYNIRGALSTKFPTFPNTGQFLPNNDLRANGVYLSGAVDLQPLIDAESMRG